MPPFEFRGHGYRPLGDSTSQLMQQLFSREAEALDCVGRYITGGPLGLPVREMDYLADIEEAFVDGLACALHHPEWAEAIIKGTPLLTWDESHQRAQDLVHAGSLR